MNPNRTAVLITAVSGLVGALAVPIANLDLSSTAGVVAGLITITTVVNRWLIGWQNYEKRNYDVVIRQEEEPPLWTHLPPAKDSELRRR